MKHQWGLDLDMSAVRLMRREGDHWSEISVEKIDSPDIEDRLTAMLDQIEPGAEVELFLPSEQILCTEVDLPPVGDTRAEIERAMDGRTPYALDELVLDWELIASGRAKVAAIAHETLDEAAAFAEVRGVGVSGYSSLGIGDVFPRLPRFDGPHVPSATAAASEPAPATETETEIVFTTARRHSRPPGGPTPPEPPVAKPEEPTAAPDDQSSEAPPPAHPAAEKTLILKPEPGASIEVSDGPVIHVDDATPVMSVKSPEQPLNPGIPVSAPNAPPRVRTDIAASTVSGSAASLTPPGGSLKVHRSGSFATVAMIFAAVFIVTLGIATLVWLLLPLSPGRTNSQDLPPAAESGQNEAPAPQTDFAAAPTTEATAPSLSEQEDITAADADPDTAAPVQPATETETETEGDIAGAPAPTEETTPLETATEEPEPEVPDLPQPEVFAEALNLVPPQAEAVPEIADASDVAPQKIAPEIVAFTSEISQPDIDTAAPLPPAPSQFADIQTQAPYPGPEPDTAENTNDIYIASIESSELASDAIALPSAFGLSADPLPSVSASPSEAPESDGAPDLAALVPEDRQIPQAEFDDAMAAAVAEALADALAGPGGLVPTKLASSVPDRAPRPRPGGFVEEIERNQFGGRTRQEMISLRPPARPDSVQNTVAAPTEPPSELAVGTSLQPRGRPQNFSALVTAARVQRDAERLRATVNTSTPDTSSAIQAALDEEPEPRRQSQRLSIPTTASVARQATIENAIRLNKVNLVGVYGSVSDRRALVRLPSGRYVKVKVGDRVDGGTVAQITDSELLYRKGNRTLSLSMPQG